MRICFSFLFFVFSVEWGCKSKGATYALMDIYDLIIIIVTIILLGMAFGWVGWGGINIHVPIFNVLHISLFSFCLRQNYLRGSSFSLRITIRDYKKSSISE